MQFCGFAVRTVLEGEGCREAKVFLSVLRCLRTGSFTAKFVHLTRWNVCLSLLFAHNTLFVPCVGVVPSRSLFHTFTTNCTNIDINLAYTKQIHLLDCLERWSPRHSKTKRVVLQPDDNCRPHHHQSSAPPPPTNTHTHLDPGCC